MKDRFDLEQDITALYSSAEDLKTVVQMMYDSDFNYDADRTWNTLYGLAEVIEAKVGKAMDTFCQVYRLDGYAPEETKRLREKFDTLVDSLAPGATLSIYSSAHDPRLKDEEEDKEGM